MTTFDHDDRQYKETRQNTSILYLVHFKLHYFKKISYIYSQ